MHSRSLHNDPIKGQMKVVCKLLPNLAVQGDIAIGPSVTVQDVEQTEHIMANQHYSVESQD
jgi:formaldehyde-activating enzyme involved in methanogenesis